MADVEDDSGLSERFGNREVTPGSMLSEAGAWADLLGDLAVFPRVGLSSLWDMSKLKDNSDGFGKTKCQITSLAIFGET